MSIIKHNGQRVGVFIDAQNLYHSAKNLYGAKVNFAAVLKEAVDDRTLVRALAYVITTESGEEQGFFEALEKVGIETKTKDLQIFIGGAKKADWDVGIAVDMIKMAPKLDAAVIASGDGDFAPLLTYLNSQGVQTEVITFGRSSSNLLREATDSFIDLDENPKQFLIGYRAGRGRAGNGRHSRTSRSSGAKTKQADRANTSKPNSTIDASKKTNRKPAKPTRLKNTRRRLA